MYKVYENIKKLRLNNNMSQQELAEAVGYKGKSMIAKIEKGEVDLPTTMVTKFAEVFGCTESYLMGWEDNIGNEPDMFLYGKKIGALAKQPLIMECANKISSLPDDKRRLVYAYVDFIISQTQLENQE